MKLRSLFLAAFMAFAPVSLAVPAAYAEPAIYTGRFSDTALQGYDPVAYFTDGQPVKGSKEFSTEYKGATFQFASAANRDAFLADPAAYAPQYGGYCAWAMADGKYAKGNAKYWKIVDGKLYLNYNAGIQKKWNADVPGFIEKADTQWQDLQE
ncbi:MULTISPECIES: YHS domain-containing (seleno)protein [Hyphomonas]|uniref:Twin-arginine translocation pathway signal protein n=1 Tax=Hyphomonas adhaerens TaxID=81029 RepID=A0A3B9GUG5_9PROT|nr:MULTISPECIES: YHS domain-containing (seleno)protein [Hyphomonas]MBB39872.1 twin-arginine translocation pathway signal protein [Hyphomonas sp.]HAE25654.1 twin-arginine translocation pathway signal protein [Hyphomonas adhaerens]|tara:strand:+ start:3948 stop:4406 length:459 start_codon:yes stop_codon:yes gene_type:complete